MQFLAANYDLIGHILTAQWRSSWSVMECLWNNHLAGDLQPVHHSFCSVFVCPHFFNKFSHKMNAKINVVEACLFCTIPMGLMLVH